MIGTQIPTPGSDIRASTSGFREFGIRGLRDFPHCLPESADAIAKSLVLAQAVSWARTPTALFPQSLTGAWVEANLRTLATPSFTNLVTANYFADPIDCLELVRQDELAVGSAAPSILSILPFPASSACIGLRANNHLVAV